MKKFKRILRVLTIALLILFASACASFGVILAIKRERAFENEIKIELVEKREDESDLKQNDVD